LASIECHLDEVWYIAISLDGSKLISVSKDKCINVWEITQEDKSISIKLKTSIKKPFNHSNDISSVTWNKDSTQILVSSDNAKIFDANTGK